jgi:tetratricopeptide (TPR) repeat protein
MSQDPQDGALERPLDTAVAAHRAGRLDEAEDLYLRILEDPAADWRAAFNLGALYLGRRTFDRAEAAFARVLRDQPDNAQAWDYHLNAMIGAEQFEAAERAIAAQADPAVAIAAEQRLRPHWAAKLARRGDFAGAEVQLRRICETAPRDPDAHNDLGALLLTAGRAGDAVAAFDQALTLAPDHLATIINQGSAYKAQGRDAEAEAAYRRALALEPTHRAALRNLGILLDKQGRADEARALDVAALAIGADVGGGHMARGVALASAGKHEAALAAFELALGHDGDRYEGLARKGQAQAGLRRYAEGLASLDAAVAMKPEDPFAIYRRAFVRLSTREFDGGWQDYEARWREPLFLETATAAPPRLRARFLTSPRREDLAGGRVAVIGEQGIGDQVMFASILPDLMRDAAAVTCVCDDRLVALFGRSFPGVTFRGAGAGEAAAAEAEVVVAMASLGHAYRRDAADFPATPYLRPDDRIRRHWAERLGPKSGALRIGLSWRGGSARSRSHERSVSLDRFAPLLDLPGCEFVSLQYGDAASDLAAVNAGRRQPIRAFASREIDDFEALAGLAAELDLVISVQTSLVHLCGAIGQACLTLVPHNPEWRYTAEGSSMPWYGSVRIFRQSEPGDWTSVIAQAAQAAKARLAAQS